MPTDADLAAWGALAGGATTSEVTKVYIGLFGYDFNCVASVCAENDGDLEDNGYCLLINARGLDGLAFGIKTVVDNASTEKYCAGFRDPIGNQESFVCGYDGFDIYTSVLYSNYSITKVDYFTSTESEAFVYGEPYYGFSKVIFGTSR